MQLTTLPFRTALVEALDGNVIYATVPIPVFEEYLMESENKRRVILSGDVEAYIILLNQTSNETLENKCNRTNNDSIQIQIVTVWPAGKGGSQVAENIANVVLSVLFPQVNSTLSFGDDLNMWRFKLLGTRNINFDGNSSRTWITQLILETWISQ